MLFLDFIVELRKLLLLSSQFVLKLGLLGKQTFNHC